MKILQKIFTAALFLIISSSLFAQKSVFTFPFENAFRIPSMQKFINTNEISASYQTMGNIYTTEFIGFGDDRMEQTSMNYFSDARVVDALKFLEIYMEEQLLYPGIETSGLVEMSIIYFHENSRANLGSVLGVVTIGLGTLLGIPYATVVTNVEVSATFYDENDNLIASHRGVGRGKKLQTLYSMSTRKAHQRAMREAIDDLNTKIMANQNLIAISDLFPVH